MFANRWFDWSLFGLKGSLKSTLAVAVLSLFVWAQTATLLHAEIHPFHQHTAECDVYQYLGQPSAASSDTVPLAETVWISQQLPVLAPSYPLVAYQTVYWGRAPPQA